MSQTFFTNESGGGGTTDYVRDVFADISLAPTNNSGFTDNALTNPLARNFANSDSVTLRQKTLYIKDIVLVSDRTKWVSNKPTYQIIWHESCPDAYGYIFGNIVYDTKTNQPFVLFKTNTDGFGLTGNIRRVAFLVEDSISTPSTAQVAIDGVNTTTIDFSGLALESEAQIHGRFSAFVNAGTNQTNDIHDYRLTSIDVGTLRFKGVIVYFENSGNNINVKPGTTYIDKSKVSTSAGATFPLPTFGSSLGGVALVYKTQTSGYAMSNQSANTVTSIASGASGANLISVSTGHGSSFPVSSGVIIPQGTSYYVGTVQQISTDTLTVFPNLAFGISSATANIYRSFIAGPTYSISSSYMSLKHSILFPNTLQGLTQGILHPRGDYAVWGDAISTQIDNKGVASFHGTSGFLQVDGLFSAADVECISPGGLLGATFSVNGLPAWSQSAGVTGTIRKTIFTDAGPGWNSFRITPNAAFATVGFYRINLYERTRDLGVSFGMLAQFSANQAYTERAPSSTIMAPGLARRVYADQLYLKGPWVRHLGATYAGGVAYRGSTTNCLAVTQYYGKEFAVIGTVGGGTLLLDNASIPNTFNSMRSVASEGFHAVQYTVGSGATATIEAFDYVSSLSEVKCLQNFDDPYEKYPPVQVNEATIMASASITVDQAMPTGANTIVNFNNIEIDTHRALVTGVDWKFVAPRKGNYIVTVQVSPNPSTLGSFRQLTLLKNGTVTIRRMGQVYINTGVLYAVQGSSPVTLEAGDYIDVRYAHDVGSDVTLAGNIDRHYIVIREIK